MTTEATGPGGQAALDVHREAVSGLFGRDFIYMAFWAVQVIIVACVTPLLTRLLHQDELGLVAAATAVTQLLNPVFGLGLQTAVPREQSGEYGTQGARQLVTLGVILAVLAGLVTFAAGRWWVPLIGLGAFPSAVHYAVLWAVLIAVTNPALSLARTRNQLRGFIAISVAQSIFAQVLALALVIFVRATATEYLLGQVLGQLGAVSIALVVARPARLSRARLRMYASTLRFSTGLVPAMVAGFVVAASDRLVIHADLGARTTSHYAVASNIGGFTVGLLGFLDFVWLPRLFAMKDDGARRRVLGSSRDGLYVLGAGFAIAIAYASPVILWIWCPPSYDRQTLVPVIALIAASAVPFADGVVYTQALILAGRTTSVAIATLVAAALNLALNLLLVPTLGITGSAGISFCCYVVYALVLRRMAGARGPATTVQSLGIAILGVALCVSSAILPTSGALISIRLLGMTIASLVFVGELSALVRPDLRKTVSRWLMKKRWVSALWKLTSANRGTDD